MSIEENKRLAERFVAAIASADIDAIVESFAEDGTCWTPGSMPISGTFTKPQIVDASKAVLLLFPRGLEFEIKAMTAEGDRVAIEAESKGIHASGKLYNNQYHFLMRVRDGKIVEWREYMDTMHADTVLCEGMERGD
jgi:uncharacterized protein (TIGR02246 family)